MISKIIFWNTSLKISIATFYDALSINLNYTDKYNSRYDGVKIINTQSGIAYKEIDDKP